MNGRVALILAAPDDLSSEVVGRELARRGCPVVAASAADLALARWFHAPDDASGTTVVLPDGHVLDDAAIGVVLNRLDGPDLPQFVQAPAVDRDYAVAEFSALLASWLNSLGAPVVNPVGGENTWAPALHPLGWHAVALQCGLAVGDFVVASTVRGGACAGLDRVGGSAWPRGSDVAGWYRSPLGGAPLGWVWAFGDDCGAGVDESLAARCRAFVRALGLHHAALGFVPGTTRSSSGPRLVEVETRPPLDAAAVAGRCADWLASLVLAREEGTS